MSAISAIYYLNEKTASSLVVGKMIDCLEHRGDDDRNLWIDGSVGLANRLRWTTEESRYERLPLESPYTGCVITCDARIDNRSELIPQLGLRSKKLCEITDSDLILAAYEKWDEECLPRLIGDFVFAIWNPRTRKLFCGRDSLGVKHFYYYHKPHQIFAMSSEIKSLLELSEIVCELDAEHLGDCLIFNFEDGESTFYKGIKRLPAVSGMQVTKDNLKIWRYWHPNPTEEIRLRNHREYQEAFREKFTEAVNCRLRSAFTVGSTLSGGLDSSSIVCAASKYLKSQSKPPLHSFSVVFPTILKIDPRIDELSYMKSVIKKSGCHPHFVNVDDTNPMKEMNQLMRHTDDPVLAPNIYMDWEMFKAAKKEGIRVMLSGIDGDSTVSHGYEDFARFARRGRIIRLIQEAIALNRNIPNRSHSFKKLVWNRGLAEALPPLSGLKSFLAMSKIAEAETNLAAVSTSILNPDFIKSLDLEKRIEHFAQVNCPTNSTDIETHWYGLSSGLMSFALELAEKTAQAFGIEQRYPFFDRRLIEFCIALPPGERMYRGWTRSIFRHAMNGILPEDVQWRKSKANLGAGVRLNLLKYGLPELEDALKTNFSVVKDYFNFENLNLLYEQHKSNPLRKGGSGMMLMNVIYLSNWLRQTGFAKNNQMNHLVV